MNPFIEELSAESDAIVEQIKPFLAGRLPPLQGVVIAELLAIWLAGHPPEMRKSLLRAQNDATRALVSIWHPRIWGRQ